MPQANAVVLIYNPVAGGITSRPRLLARVTDVLRGHFGAVESAPTAGPGMAGALAREWIGRGADLVCVAGGDGTLNEAASGIAGTGIPLAVIPAGTANVLANELGIGNDAVRAAERLGRLDSAEIAVGTLKQGGGRRLFLDMAGAGLDARIVRLVSPEFKRRFGKLSYWQGGFAQLGRPLPEFEVQIEGRCSRASFALISRVTNYGGDLTIARHANLLAEDFAVVLFEGPSSFRYLKYFAGVLLNALERMKGVTVTRARRVELRPAGDAVIDIQVDGELAGTAPAVVEIAEEKLQVLAPANFVARMRQRLEKASAGAPGPDAQGA